MPQHYIPVRGMIEIVKSVSSTEQLQHQYVNCFDYETDIAHAFNEGRRIGAEEKSLDYQVAKEKRIYEEKKVLNSAIEQLKFSLEKIENCKAKL